MFEMFRSRKLEDVLNETKTVKVLGVRAKIRRVNMLNYLDGSKTLNQIYDLYKVGNTEVQPVHEKKIKEYFSHILVAGIVEPKLSLTDGEEGTIFVEKMFSDWRLVEGLYEEIMMFTYGKKKLK